MGQNASLQRRTPAHPATITLYVHRAERRTRFTTHCMLVFVAMNDQGRPTAIPGFAPHGPQQQRMNDYARKMIELRRNLDSEAGSFLRDLELDAGSG